VLNVDTKQIVTSVSARGNGLASILESQIDELSRAIIKSVGLTGLQYEEPGNRIQDVTTTSLDAYDYFLKGREAFDKMYFPESAQYLEKALRIDPGFAIAHLYLSYNYGAIGMRKQQQEELEKAFLNSARATENERLAIQAAYAGDLQQNPMLQLSLLLQLAEKAPKDKRVFYTIGLWYRENGNPDLAIEYFSKAVDLDPNFGEAINQLAYRYFYKGDYDRALVYLKKYAELNPYDANPFDSMGDLFWQMGDLDQSLENYTHALELKPDFYMSASKITYIYAIKEDYEQVRYWMQKTIEITPNKQMSAVMLWCTAFYDYNTGRIEQALKTLETFRRAKDETHLVEMAYNWLNANISLDRGRFEESLKFNELYLEYALLEASNTALQDTNSYYFNKGLCYVKWNRLDSAAKYCSLLRKISGDTVNDFNYRYLQMEIRIARSRSAEELDKLPALPVQNVSFSMPGTLIVNVPFTRNSLAEAYARLNEPGKAIAEYERLITFDSTATDRYLVNPRYHYYLGILYENNGKKEKAAEQYRKFLDIFKDADAAFLEIKDARNRLESIKNLY
jgi:tetratricopeptide (TPR) repeat protein